MKKLFLLVLLRVFGIKPKQNTSNLVIKKCKTVLPDEQCGSFNAWIKQIYHQLNPNVC